MIEHRDLVAKLTDELRGMNDVALDANGYTLIRDYVTSPIAFSNVERLSRIRAVVEAVEAARAQRG